MPRVATPKFVDEFKQFAIRGNVIDLAVGVIIGSSFGNVVTSVVTDVVMPPIAFLTGGVDFKDKFLTLSKGRFATLADAQAAGAITVNYGAFINTVIDFAIVAFVIFLLVKTVNRIKSEPAPAAPDTRECPRCMMTIKKTATRCAYCTSEVAVA